MSSKTEVKAKVPVTAPQDKSSRDTRKANKPGPQSEVCRFFLKNECSRGSNCAFLHMKPSESSSNKYAPGKRKSHVQGPGEGIPQKPEVCRKFIQGTCRRGSGCRYYHPSVEEMRGSQEERVAWFALCPDIMSDFCNNIQCSFFHISKQDEEMYRNGGEISPELVDQAVLISLARNLTLIGALPYCKEFLRGLCTMQNCQLQHLSKREYKDEVFYALLEELQQKYSNSTVGNFGDIQNDFHSAMCPSSHLTAAYRDDSVGGNNPGLLGRYPGDMMAADGDKPSLLGPHPDQDPERRRVRYQHDDPEFPEEDMTYETPGLLGRYPGDKMTTDIDDPCLLGPHPDQEQRRKRARYQHDDQREDMRYDNPIDFEWEETQLPLDKGNLMDQVIAMQKENTNMRKEFEGKTRALRERLSKLEEENSKLREDAIEIQVAHRLEMKTLTGTNTMLQKENNDLRRAIDSKIKVSTSELQKRLEAAEKKADNARESFTKLNSVLKESETKRSKLVAEIGKLRAELQDRQNLISDGEDVKHLDNNSGYSRRDEYSRDMDLQGYGTQGQWSAHMESNRPNESHMRKPQRSRNMEISNINETMRNYENLERKGSRSQYSTSTRYKE